MVPRIMFIAHRNSYSPAVSAGKSTTTGWSVGNSVVRRYRHADAEALQRGGRFTCALAGVARGEVLIMFFLETFHETEKRASQELSRSDTLRQAIV